MTKGRMPSLVATFVAAALFAVGCGVGGDNSSEKPRICAESCSGKEVTETGCNEGALDAVVAEVIKVEGVPRGKLGVRKSNPAVCARIYWVRFEPDAKNTAAFEVKISVDGRVAEPQLSEPGNPQLAAWTLGVYAPSGAQVSACVSFRDLTNSDFCLKTFEAVA